VKKSDTNSPSKKNVGATFLFLGVVMLGFVGYNWSKSHEAQTWIQVPCKIIQASSGGRGGGKVRYTYEFAGNHYESNRVTFGLHSRNATYRRAFEDGRAVTCFVDPQNPAEAVLERDVDAVFVFLCIVFTAVGAGLTIRKRLMKKSAGIDEAMELPRE
jgi:hypothetical protein